MEKPFTILCIEKNDLCRSALKIIDAQCQSHIRIARSFAEAAEILDTEEIHIIAANEEFLGIMEELIPLYPDPVKILTGYGNNPEILIRAINCGGIRCFVSMQPDETQLRNAIAHALENCQKQKENKRLVDDLQYMLHKMNFLHEISGKISEIKPLPNLLSDIMESSRAVMNAEASSLLLYDPVENRLHFNITIGDKGPLLREFSVEMGEGIAGWVAQHRKPQLIRDCYSDPRFNPEMDRKISFRTCSMICIPMIRYEQLIGVMQVINKKDGCVFEDRDLIIFETLASQCAVAIENARLVEIHVQTQTLERELETAREIQQSLLAASLPPYEDIDCAADLIPARQVGGDYYTIRKIGENRSLFFIADVVGKSIPAALIVSTLCSCLNTYIRLNPDHFDLMTLVTGMNRVILDSVTADKFVTAWFGLYYHDTRVLSSINAGHNRPMIFRKGKEKPVELGMGGLALGIFDSSYRMQEIRLQKDDVLVFYTDGITEAWDEKGEQYETCRLIRSVSDNLGRSAAEILSEIRKDVKHHVGNAPQSDDLTCAVIRICRSFMCR
ncbi:MAG: SpoIIE family protein phosphatase [Desulfococcaceae bacterium]